MKRVDVFLDTLILCKLVSVRHRAYVIPIFACLLLLGLKTATYWAKDEGVQESEIGHVFITSGAFYVRLGLGTYQATSNYLDYYNITL